MPVPDGLSFRFRQRCRFEAEFRLSRWGAALKAFLLAGGYGTRLRPLTDSVPKCLLPIKGRPLLDIWLDLCARSGIDEVLINLHAHAQVIERHLSENTPPLKVRLVTEKQLLGSAGTVKINRDWIGNDRTFWIFYSDVLTNANLRLMSEFHSRHEDVATLGLYQVPDPSRCGVALTNDAEIITEFEEKPPNPRSNWVFSGLMLAGQNFRRASRRIWHSMSSRSSWARCGPIASTSMCSTSVRSRIIGRRKAHGPEPIARSIHLIARMSPPLRNWNLAIISIAIISIRKRRCEPEGAAWGCLRYGRCLGG